METVKLFLCYTTLLRDLSRGTLVLTEQDLRQALFYFELDRDALFDPGNEDMVWVQRENGDAAQRAHQLIITAIEAAEASTPKRILWKSVGKGNTYADLGKLLKAHGIKSLRAGDTKWYTYPTVAQLAAKNKVSINVVGFGD